MLALSLRATSPAVGREILGAFLATPASQDAGDRHSIEAVEESALVLTVGGEQM